MTVTVEDLMQAGTQIGRPSHPTVPAFWAPSLVRPGTFYGLVTDASDRNFAHSLRRIQENSGLTWGEVAAVLGVSRRTIHHWLTSAKVSGENAQRIAHLYRAITQELTDVPRERAREHLLAPGPDGARLASVARGLRDTYPRRRRTPRGFDLLRVGVQTDTKAMVTGGLDESIPVVEVDERADAG